MKVSVSYISARWFGLSYMGSVRATGFLMRGIRYSGGANSPSGNTSKTTKAAMKNQPKDRLGQAVVSLIFGIFGILFFIVGMLKLGFDSQYSYTTSTGTMATILFAFILSVVGFFLGIIARRSSKGRGMAIAGITLTTLPVVVMILIIGGGLVLNYMRW